ncbi:MAG: hypothetical protein ACKO3K_09010 [Cuspidothrix sp.]
MINPFPLQKWRTACSSASLSLTIGITLKPEIAIAHYRYRTLTRNSDRTIGITL